MFLHKTHSQIVGQQIDESKHSRLACHQPGTRHFFQSVGNSARVWMTSNACLSLKNIEGTLEP